MHDPCVAARETEIQKMRRIYFDHNATSPLRPALRERLEALLDQDFSNPGSIHQQGQTARTIVEQARRRILQSVEGTHGTLTFTASATESNNTALASLSEGDVLLTSAIEHPSVRKTAERLQERGVEVRQLPHDAQGVLDLEVLPNILEDVTFVALMAANNELGNINDIEEIGRICLEADVPLHVDAVQVWGRWPFKIWPGVSSAALSAHKAGGPVGVAALWVDRRERYDAILFGGQQERGRRAGTENVLWIDLMGQLADAERFAWPLSGALRDQLASAFEAIGGVRNGHPTAAMPNTLNMSFPGFTAEELVMALDLEGISVSTGSACTAGSVEVSEVLQALGLSEERSASAVRWSLGPDTTEQDVRDAAETMDKVLARIRS